MTKFLKSGRNRLILVIMALVGIVLGIGAFVTVTLLQRHSQNQQSSSSSLDNASAAAQQKDKTYNPTSALVDLVAPPSIPFVITEDSASDAPSLFSSDISSTNEFNLTMVPIFNNSVSTNITNSTVSTNSSTVTTTNSTTTVNSTLTSVSPTIFYAIGDVPYTRRQHERLEEQILNLPSDAEFLIHLGDVRLSTNKPICYEDEYTSVSETLQLSKVPVFIIPGDNDVIDCPNLDQGKQYWNDTFLNFHDRYWTHNFSVTSQPYYPNNFVFIHKQTIYFGINIVAGPPLDSTVWHAEMKLFADWVILNILEYVESMAPTIPNVVIFGHADYHSRFHVNFFDPLTSFVRDQLRNSVPVLYICGNKHEWYHQYNFLEQSSMQYIVVTGQVEDPPLKVMINENGVTSTPNTAITYDRMLPCGHPSLNGTSCVVSVDDTILYDTNNGWIYYRDSINATQ